VTPSVSVVIATRDRPAAVARAVGSVLESVPPDVDVVVVDQSQDGATRAALGPLVAGDPRLRYRPSAARGVSAGRNAGIGDARGEIVAITDDDCRASAGWLGELLAPLAADPTAGVAFGSVVPGAHDRRQGFVPAFVVGEPFTARRAFDRHLLRGLGPCLAVRRPVWAALRGFDEALGVGGRFPAGEIPDFALRAVRAGHGVVGTPRARVTHDGFRPWSASPDLVRAYCYGGGAMWAKHAKCGHLAVGAILVRLGTCWAGGRSPVIAPMMERPRRWWRLAWFLRGFAAGLRAPVDRRTGHYRAAGQSFPTSARAARISSGKL
jgi:glycosyltransferase involved in cell wall biosynthesis